MCGCNFNACEVVFVCIVVNVIHVFMYGVFMVSAVYVYQLRKSQRNSFYADDVNGVNKFCIRHLLKKLIARVVSTRVYLINSQYDSFIVPIIRMKWKLVSPVKKGNLDITIKQSDVIWTPNNEFNWINAVDLIRLYVIYRRWAVYIMYVICVGVLVKFSWIVIY